MSRKIVTEDRALKSPDDSVTAIRCQDIINTTNALNSKAVKSKDNKLALENESYVTTNAKRSKCQGKAKINREAVDARNQMQNKENVKASERPDNAKEKGSVSPSEKSKKYNAKEAKEKRNKEDTRHKNRENEGNDIERNKEIPMPSVRNKEQLREQVHVPVARFMD